MWVIHLWFKGVTHKERAISSKNSFFFICFWQFFPFLTQERSAPIALCSFALFQRVAWAICSHLTIQKSDLERFAQVAQVSCCCVNSHVDLLWLCKWAVVVCIAVWSSAGSSREPAGRDSALLHLSLLSFLVFFCFFCPSLVFVFLYLLFFRCPTHNSTFQMCPIVNKQNAIMLFLSILFIFAVQ